MISRVDLSSLANSMKVREANIQATELQRSIMALEAGLKKIDEKQKKLNEMKLNFALHVLKLGIDTRDDGCVWLMRETSKLGVEITDSFLPDFIDSYTKEVILRKFKYYQMAMDLREKNKFQMEFYKLMSSDDSLVENAMKMISLGNKREEQNPMLEFIGEMNSIAINKRPKFSALTMGRPESMTNYYDNLSFVDQASPNRLESAFNQSVIEDKAFLTEAGVARGPIQDEASQPQLEGIKEEQLRGQDVVEIEPAEIKAGQEAIKEETSVQQPETLSKRISASARRLEFHFSSKEEQLQDKNKAIRPLVSANHRLQLISARSNFSLAESTIVKRKKAEFEQRGIVYIGDANYNFGSSNLYGVYSVPEATQIGRELVSKALRRHKQRESSQYSSSTTGQPGLQSVRSALVSASLPSISVASSNALTRGASSRIKSTVAAADIEEDDPFDTHIKFYDGETLINSFESKQELFDQQTAVTQHIERCEASMEKLERSEFTRMYDLYKTVQRNAANLEARGIRATERMMRRQKETTVLIPHFEEKPVASYDVDLLMYLATVMGYANSRKLLINKETELEKASIMNRLLAKR